MSRAPFGNQELYEALMRADLAALKRLHAQGFNFNISDTTYGTPLTVAISVLKPAMVDFLLEHGADPNNVASNRAGSALESAVVVKEVAMVKSLLAHGANPSYVNADGGSPLISAVSVESLEIVKLLVDAGADLLVTNKYGVNVLNVIELGRSKKIRDYILDKAKAKPLKLNPVQAAKLGRTDALIPWLETKPAEKELIKVGLTAASAGHAEVVKLLIRHGLSPSARGKPDEKMVHWPEEEMIFWAAYGGHMEVVQGLIEAGASVNICNKHQVTPLHTAVQGKHPKVVKVLLEAGADPLRQDEKGNSPVSIARQFDMKQIAKILEKAIARKPQETTSLLEAVSLGSVVQVKKHLEAGADAELANPQGLTAAQVAVNLANVPVLQTLLEHGARVQPASGRSTWELALGMNSSPEVIKALLEYGLDVNQHLFQERTQMLPLQYAVAMVTKNTEAVLDLLFAAGADPHQTYMVVLPPSLKKSYEELVKVGSPMAKVFGGTKTLLELAASNRKASNYLKAKLNIAKDAYDLAVEKAKTLPAALEEPVMAGLVEELSKTLHAKPQPWKRRKGVISFWLKLRRLVADEKDIDGFLRELSARVRGQGGQLVYARLPEGSDSRTELLFYPTNDPYVVMATCGTNGANYGLGTREVLKWFVETAKSHPFSVVGCSFDFVDVHFQTPIADAAGLMAQLVKFCPDLDDGETTRSVKEFSETGDCFLWWD